MVITMPASVATLFEVAMAAEGLGFECVGEGTGINEYIVTPQSNRSARLCRKPPPTRLKSPYPTKLKLNREHSRLHHPRRTRRQTRLARNQVPQVRATGPHQSSAVD